ncbi:MAG TPA: inositol monophosphatase family protein [Pilimelia sp.]|nr:inositol monophosphatase family protein [Pilimelia sp.]
MPEVIIEQVGELLRHAARTAVLPMFGRLADGDVTEKAPGELVTVADRDAERVISAGLRDLLPGSAVVGEEAVADDPAVLDRLGDAGAVWLVDPVDGTANFAAGRGPFMIMVALLRDGQTTAAWILDPRADSLACARRGAGAYVDGVRVWAGDAARPATGLRGAVMARFLPAPLGAQVRDRAEGLGVVLPGQHCAGQEYPDVVRGVQDFVLFWKTLPWDHAPGALFTEEAGGVVRRLDGSPYDPTDQRPFGLLAAASPPVWGQVRDALFPGEALGRVLAER